MEKNRNTKAIIVGVAIAVVAWCCVTADLGEALEGGIVGECGVTVQC